MEDQNAWPDDPVSKTVAINSLFERLPPWVVDTLTNEQKEAIHKAVSDPEWDMPPLNIRLSLPLLKRRYYVTVVGGEEKRSSSRRAHDRNRYPLRTVANFFFFIGLITIFYVVAVVGIAIYSSIIEF